MIWREGVYMSRSAEALAGVQQSVLAGIIPGDNAFRKGEGVAGSGACAAARVFLDRANAYRG